jgi:hypothetical protein
MGSRPTKRKSSGHRATKRKEGLTENEEDYGEDDEAEYRSDVSLCIDEAGPLAQRVSEGHDAQTTEGDAH